MSMRCLSLAAVLLFLTSAQSSLGQSAPVSFSFIDERGYDAVKVSEWGRVRLRMVAPSWDLSAQRDEWSASLTSALGQDTESITLVETGERTGVFEGTMEVWVSAPGGDRFNFIDTYRDYNNINNNDVITATFDGGAAVDTIEAVPSVLQLADSYGAPVTSYAVGETVHVRLRDGFANTPNLDLRPVTVTTSRGDSETFQISETGIDTGVFEGSLGATVTAGPPVPGNGALEVQAGDTLTAGYDDINHVTSSTASAAVAPLGVRFIEAEGGGPASVFLERSQAWVRVTYPVANTYPQYRDVFPVDVAADLSGETEGVYLWETGPDSGVFEGWVRLSGYPTSFGDGNLWTNRLTNPDRFDTLRVNVQLGQTIYTATAATAGSRLRLTDAAGDDASAFALGAILYFQVEDLPTSGPPYPNSPPAQVILRSLSTGDMETLSPLGTAVGSGLFEGSIRVGTGPAVPEDGLLQAAPGETIEASHADFNGLTSSRRVAVAVERLIRFVDESGRSISTLLEGRPARLRAFDIAVAGQPQIVAEVTSLVGGDQESVFLAPVEDEPGAFEGSIPLVADFSGNGSNGLLRVSGGFIELGDTVTATLDPLPSVEAQALPARVRFLEDRGLDADFYPLGTPWHIRVEDRGFNRDSGLVESTPLTMITAPSGQETTVYLTETGPDTGVFETVVYPGTIQVEPGGSVTALHRPYLAYLWVTDRAEIVERSVEFVDAAGLPTSTYLAGSRIYVRAFDASANLSASQVETLQVQLAMAAPRGESGDTETLTLTETGADTGLFTGSIGMLMTYTTPGFNDGQIQVSPYTPPLYEAEILRVYLADLQDSVRFLDSVLRFIDDQGEDASSYVAGSPVRLRLERPLDNYNQIDVDVRSVEVFSLTSGDREPVVLTETGVNTGVFEGSLPTRGVPGSADPFDGILQVQGDEIVQAFDSPYVPQSTDHARMLPAPVPVLDAQNDETATEEDTPITVDVLANDSSSSGPLTVTDAVITYGTGSVTIEPDFRLTYTPAPNEIFGAIIAYTVTDGVLTATATLNVGIYPVNDPPVVVDDAAMVIEDGQVVIDVLANDDEIEFETENQGLALIGVTQGANGSVTIQGNYWVVYTPDLNFSGIDTFTYEVTDDHGGFSTGTVTVEVYPVNDFPLAVADAATTSEDTAVSIAVLANDTDVEGETLSVAAVTQGTKGSVAISGTNVIYTPNANASGSDSFTYTVTDGTDDIVGTVTVTINAVNDAPVAVNDSATTNEDAAVTIAVLANDTDAENNTLSVSAVTQGAKGGVTISGTSVIYTPNANANGADSFTYTVSDGTGSATGTVTVTITAVNDAPEAVNDSASTNEDTAVTIAVLDNDTDVEGNTLSVSAVTQGAKGGVTISGTSVIYTPNANANGTDSFTYTVSDGTGSATGTVTVTITPVNDAPDAVNDVAATSEDTAATFAIVANDLDVDGEAVTVIAVTQGSLGAVTLNANGSVTYIPAPNANGADAFTYTVRDGAGLTDTATVTVAVAAVNDAPVAVADAATTREGAPVTISVLANDSDIEGNTLSVTSVSGSAVIHPDGTVTYTPAANFNGTASFTYTVSDGQGGTATGTVTVTVKDALERVAVLATHGVWIQTGADILSGDVIVNQSGTSPFMDGGASELSVAGTVTTPAGYDVQANRINLASGSTVGGDAFYNQLTGTGSIMGTQTSSLTLPVFASLPALPAATPGATDVNVANNGTRTLAPGSYRDLIVGRKGTVTFTGGVYHFRTVQIDREAKLFFSAAAEVRVQQKLSTQTLTVVQPAAGATIDASSIVFFVAGANGTTGALAATPKSVEIGTDNVFRANLQAPNGTIWLKDRTQATGAFLGKDVQVGPDAQITLDSYWVGQ